MVHLFNDRTPRQPEFRARIRLPVGLAGWRLFLIAAAVLTTPAVITANSPWVAPEQAETTPTPLPAAVLAVGNFVGNLHLQPSLEAPIVAHTQPGQQLPVTGKTEDESFLQTVYAGQPVWIQNSGLYGHLEGSLETVPVINSVNPPQALFVAGEAGCILRADPSLTADRIIDADEGKRLLVTGKTADERYLLVTFAARTGWVPNNALNGYVEGDLSAVPVFETPIAADTIFIVGLYDSGLREWPSLHAAQVIPLHPGDELAVIGRLADASYLFVTSGSVQGWIENTAWHGRLQGDLSRVPVVTQMIVVQVETANLRDGPGPTYPVIGSAARGEELEAIEERQGWYRIRQSNGAPAWISATVAKLKPDS